MAKIITYHGSEDALVWLKERKGMDSDTELVVPFAHEVIFVKNGKMTDSFISGRYNLSECAVGEGRLFNTACEKVDCRIYFVKKEGCYGIKFAAGVLSIFDPVLKTEVDLDLNGAFAIKIIDSKQFLSKMLSNTQKASLPEVKSFFKSRMLVYIKEQLVDAMDESGINAAELNCKLMPISKDLQLKMRYVFESYGVSIEDFMLKDAKLLSYDGEATAKRTRKIPCKCAAANPEAELKREINAETEEIKGEAMYCPGCGLDIPPLSKFCNHCGEKIE